jgi:hypothetical protein
LLLALLAPATLLSQQIPLTNWTVPAYRRAGASGGLTPMTDLSPGVAFVAMSPCRIVDTREAAGPYAGPALATNVARTFDIDNGPCTGIPAGVEAYSLSFGAILPPADGFLTAWPTGTAQPVFSQVNLIAGEVVANAAIVPAGTGGSINVLVNIGPTNVYIDINGYFTDQYNTGVQFTVLGDFGGAGSILGVNNSTGLEASGVLGVISAASPAGNSAGVSGRNFSAGDAGFGVTGTHFGSGIGVHGISLGLSGGFSKGVNGQTLSMSDGAVGVNGGAIQPTGRTYGVVGSTQSSALGAAGVKGRDGTGTLTGVDTCCFSAGVRGEAKNGNGVLGLSEAIGSIGVLRSAAGANLAVGYLGAIQMAANYGVYSTGNAHVAGTFTATTKSFVEPHPFDPSKEIRYVSLEGPHSEVYFRGTAQIAQGVTRIPIPEDFRFVADAATYSTLVTPVGGMATVAVLSEGEDGIVVQASRNVKVHYVVYAEREAVRNPDPIVENIHFRPEPDDEMLAHVPDSYRRLMIQNGTLNPDGTVNRETAQRLGWDSNWRGHPDGPKPTVVSD